MLYVPPANDLKSTTARNEQNCQQGQCTSTIMYLDAKFQYPSYDNHSLTLEKESKTMDTEEVCAHCTYVFDDGPDEKRSYILAD